MALRIDDIGFDNIRLIQDSDAFCYGVDAVLLADFAMLRQGSRMCELGSGNGAVSFIAYAKYKPAYIAGVEIQPAQAALARESAELNGLSALMDFYEADVKDVRELFEAESFDAVCSNPPYFEKGRGVDAEGPRHIARQETSAGLADFFESAAYLLKKGGSLYMVHRPSRLGDIIEYSRKKGLEAKTLRMVAPRPGEAANIVLVEFVKGAGKELRILPQLYVRNADGSYSDELNAIYGREQ